MDLLVWDSEGPQGAKGHFQHEVGANCIVLLIVLCLGEGGVFIYIYIYVVAKSVCSTGGGGGAGTGPFTPTPPPLPCWFLAGKCRTMGAEGALGKFCLN